MFISNEIVDQSKLAKKFDDFLYTSNANKNYSELE